ncbi:sensor histidine kinase [Streptoalloteichus hindustanus]|uniref:histidine kinase n=1 Tax=Streptoalloteichus hindustanus TaxID=2017 RepID=A0A1M4WD49_STRHI|nr:nitrate- and nitrite sensing domain-containing protein [Streptoalloteichus hindustanus]SHE79105.1 Signal transduction histidine kinase [Streptoalloteichus hindustanus]
MEDLLTVARQDTTPSGSAGQGPARPPEDHEEALAVSDTGAAEPPADAAGDEPSPEEAASEKRPPKRVRWRLRNWHLRTKMVAVLLVPTITALVLGAIHVNEDLDGADQFGKYVKHVELAEKAAELVQELQRERTLVATFVARQNGNQGAKDRPQMDAQISKVDAAVGSVSRVAVTLDETHSAVKEPFQRAMDGLGTLKALRQAAVSSKYPDSAIVTRYTDIINGLLEANHAAANATSGTAIAQVARAADAIGRAKEQVSQQHALLLVASVRDKFQPAELTLVRGADARFEAALAEFNNAATPQQRIRYNDTVSGQDVDQRQRIKQTALVRAEQNTKLEVQAEAWEAASSTTTAFIRDVERALATELRETAQALADDAQARALRNSALILFVLALAVLLTLVIARSLLHPLKVLRVSALDVARKRLPEVIQTMRDSDKEVPEVKVEPVAVHSTEEIGQVARAFDDVHNTAVRLAAEQALLRANVNAMFVNLSRRSQALVERQLNLIDRLEQDEQDPDQLGHLFELDHLATRMRRNSENLLVLAGTDLTRRLSRPVPVSDVIGAAVSEVEQYARIDVAPTPDLAVQGRAVNDLVHLVAELLDNATAFSDPNSRVSVRTARSRGGELVVEITDRGVGMPNQDLSEANERLANPPRVDVGVSRRMGLYVVARLAKRHEIKVRLRSEELEGGLIALVVVPRELIVELRPEPGPGSMPSGSGSTFPPIGTTTGTLPPTPVPAATPAPPAPPPPAPPAPPKPATATATGFAPVNGLPPAPVQDEEPVPAAPARPAEPAQQPQFDLSVRVTSGDGADDPAAVPQVSPAAPAERRPVAPTPDTRPELELELADGGAEPPVGEGGRCGPPPAPPGRPEPGSLFWAAETTTLDPVDLAAPSGQAERPTANAGPGVVAGGTAETDETAKEVEQDVDAPTERLPIYEAVLTQWFQSVADELPTEGEPPRPQDTLRSDPLGPITRTTPAPAPAAEPPAPAADPLPKRTPRKLGEPAGDPAAPARPSTRLGRPRPGQQLPTTAHADADAGQPATPASWGSGDEGWAAAKALLNQSTDEVTSAGLPKRVPKAHLVPGSAAPKQQQQPSTPLLPTPPRSADAVRGRLSSFQHGLRRGRHRLDDPSAPAGGETPSPSQSRHDEEQE